MAHTGENVSEEIAQTTVRVLVMGLNPEEPYKITDMALPTGATVSTHIELNLNREVLCWHNGETTYQVSEQATFADLATDNSSQAINLYYHAEEPAAAYPLIPDRPPLSDSPVATASPSTQPPGMSTHVPPAPIQLIPIPGEPNAPAQEAGRPPAMADEGYGSQHTPSPGISTYSDVPPASIPLTPTPEEPNAPAQKAGGPPATASEPGQNITLWVSIGEKTVLSYQEILRTKGIMATLRDLCEKGLIKLSADDLDTYSVTVRMGAQAAHKLTEKDDQSTFEDKGTERCVKISLEKSVRKTLADSFSKLKQALTKKRQDPESTSSSSPVSQASSRPPRGKPEPITLNIQNGSQPILIKPEPSDLILYTLIRSLTGKSNTPKFDPKKHEVSICVYKSPESQNKSFVKLSIEQTFAQAGAEGLTQVSLSLKENKKKSSFSLMNKIRAKRTKTLQVSPTTDGSKSATFPASSNLMPCMAPSAGKAVNIITIDVVGKKESGKTTLLEALAKWGDNADVERQDTMVSCNFHISYYGQVYQLHFQERGDISQKLKAPDLALVLYSKEDTYDGFAVGEWLEKIKDDIDLHETIIVGTKSDLPNEKNESKVRIEFIKEAKIAYVQTRVVDGVGTGLEKLLRVIMSKHLQGKELASGASPSSTSPVSTHDTDVDEESQEEIMYPTLDY